MLIEKDVFLKRKPFSLNAELKYKYDISDAMMLTCQGKYRRERKDVQNRFHQPAFHCFDIGDKSDLLTGELELTRSLIAASVIQFNLSALSYDASHQFDYGSPAGKMIAQHQANRIGKYMAIAKYYRRTANSLFLTLLAGCRHDRRDGDVEISTAHWPGDGFVHYVGTFTYLSPGFSFTCGASTFNVNMPLGYWKEVVESRLLGNGSKGRFLVSPNAAYTFKKGGSSFTLSGRYGRQPLDPSQYIGHYTDYRSYRNAAEQYNFEKSEYGFNVHYNLFNLDGTFVLASYSWMVSRGAFTTNYDISPALDCSTPVFSDKGRTVQLGFLNVKKCVDALRHGIDFSTSYHRSGYHNSVNGVERPNRMASWGAKITIKSSFDFPLNYMAGVKFNYSAVNIASNAVLDSYTYSFFQNLIFKVGRNLRVKLSIDEHFLDFDRKYYVIADYYSSEYDNGIVPAVCIASIGIKF